MAKLLSIFSLVSFIQSNYEAIVSAMIKAYEDMREEALADGFFEKCICININKQVVVVNINDYLATSHLKLFNLTTHIYYTLCELDRSDDEYTSDFVNLVYGYISMKIAETYSTVRAIENKTKERQQKETTAKSGYILRCNIKLDADVWQICDREIKQVGGEYIRRNGTTKAFWQIVDNKRITEKRVKSLCKAYDLSYEKFGG